MGKKIRRGQIYRVNLPGDPGVYQQRSVLVLQNDIGNRICPTIIVTPLITAARARNLFFSVQITHRDVPGLPENMVTLLFQLFTLPRDSLSAKNYVGIVPPAVMKRVDEGLKISLGLGVMQEIQNRYQYG